MAKLTKRFIESINPPQYGYRIEWDETLKGFGVRVMASGVKTYVYLIDLPVRRQKKVDR